MKLRTKQSHIPLLLPLLLVACATPQGKPPGDAHLTQAALPTPDAGIPTPVKQNLAVPKPKGNNKTETYSVVVNNVRVHDLLFALARDAKINVDIHPGLQGNVTLNAIDQTLPQILGRLAKQLDLRWELDGQTLAVMPDTPYLQTYRIDYVNMKREATGSVKVTGEIGEGTASSGNTGNATTAKIDNTSKNHFWETLTQNIKDMLRETDKILPEGSVDTQVEQSNTQTTNGVIGQTGATAGSAGAKTATGQLPVAQQANATTTVKRATFREAASVIANPETGLLSVRATSRQQEKIQQFLDQVMLSAKRQVLIEATIAEVELSRRYEQGIDWGEFKTDATRSGIAGVTGGAVFSPPGASAGAQLVLGRSANGTSDMAIRLLETFGTVKVLSSPKISALNNQSALMRVVDNQVFFNVKANTVTGNAGLATTTYTTEQKSVPVGFVMSVTPQISDADEIVLNVRPSITRLNGFALDPNPSLTNLATGARIDNRIPNIRTREMETVLRIQDGSVAVLGGLMEDAVDNADSAVPWFHSIPVVGALFTQRNDLKRKTELVIFIKPTIIRQHTDQDIAKNVRNHLPQNDFLKVPPDPRFQILPSGHVDSEESKK